jgi:hypothetical protein
MINLAAKRTSVIALLLLGACTPRGTNSDGPTTIEPVEATDEHPSAAARSPVVTPATVHTSEPEPPLLAPGTPPVPGFVIYTAEQTIIVPIDGSPRTIGEGLWVQDDRSSPPALSHTMIMSEARAQTMQLPRCPCLALDGACEEDSLESREFSAQTGAMLDPPGGCRCMRAQEVLGFPPFDDDDGEHYEACMGAEEEVLASMVGGQLHFLGWEWNGACHGGLSLYDAVGWSHFMVDNAPDLSTKGMRTVGCEDIGPAYAGRPWPIDSSAFMDECGDYFESEAFMLRRGRLYSVRDDISFAHGWRSYLERPARPDSCPSINDPCGDPQPFKAKAKLDRKRREYWIATDGSAALTAEGRAWALWPVDADVAIEFELPNAHATNEVIGVRVHPDIGPLRALLGKHPTLGTERPERAPTTVQPQECVEASGSSAGTLSAKQLGNTCFMYIGIEQWVDAEQACLRGLSVADEPNTRGAILFNLGLIAEAQGAREQAALYYRESLAARPGNRAVERKLATLRSPE